eukprot:TRINITY_DN10386_c0_g1_i4.p1 TRINITY_DN10386_c0_g1~~TRINITY_DN10386_c0_g1_i4.p1  ORF type:complete len:465 (+),score=93.75 TRINITY_DN10386_c0_g1_i4:227-1621(+)
MYSTLLLPSPSSASTLSLLEAQSRKTRVDKVRKRNEKTLRHLQRLLALTASSALETSSKQNSPFIQEITPGRFTIDISAVKRCAYNSIIYYSSSKSDDMLERLEELRREIEEELSDWSEQGARHKKLIALLESYKRLVNALLDTNTDPYARLASGLRILRNRVQSEAAEVPPYAWKCPRNVYGQKVLKSGKEYVEELGGKHSPWLQEEYFVRVPLSVVQNLHATAKGSSNLDNVEFLSLHAVNRLSAIAKMLNYCKEQTVSLIQFKKGRTKQKLAALRSQHKLLANEHPNSSSTSSTSAAADYYPSSEELGYLCGLDVGKLCEVVAELKGRICARSGKSEREEVMERYFEHYLEGSKERKEKIVRSVVLEEAANDRGVDNELVERYSKLIPSMKKKRETILAEEQRQLRKLKTKDDQVSKTCHSESKFGDDSLKNLSTSFKPVFKIVNAHDRKLFSTKLVQCRT